MHNEACLLFHLTFYAFLFLVTYLFKNLCLHYCEMVVLNLFYFISVLIFHLFNCFELIPTISVVLNFIMQIAFWKKANLIFLFFLLRKLILPFYSFTLFCIILPMTMFVPEAELPTWVVCYIPATMSFLNILPAPRSFPFIVPYLLFENTMSVTKFNAMISGLFQLGSAYEWVVTKKSGRSSEGDLASLSVKEPKHHPVLDSITNEVATKLKKQPKKKHNRIYRKELALAFLLLTAAARSLLSGQGLHFYFLLFQGISFLLVGLDLIGEQIE